MTLSWNSFNSLRHPVPDSVAMRLFDKSTLNKLEQLTFVADDVRAGLMKGNRRSRKRGVSLEFAEYRDYTKGDDLRRLDWNVFARLERPFIKLTQDEEDLTVHILVDTSDSMSWSASEDAEDDGASKLGYAMQLAGALGYIGLLAGDLVCVTLFDSRDTRRWGPFRGRQNSWPLLQFLEANYASLSQPAKSNGRRTTLDLSLRDYAHRAQRPGLLFLLSDLLSPGTYRDALAALQGRGYEIALLHILSEEEMTPQWTGDLRLIDAENGDTAEVTLDPVALEEYALRIAAWQSEIEAYCISRDIRYTKIITSVPWEQIVFQSLPRQRIIR